MSYMELILSIDVRGSSGKGVLSIINRCKSRDYSDENFSLACDDLKKKFDPVSAPLLVKTERSFR
jgi:hypothetical protein